jgi:hypothetical protein
MKHLPNVTLVAVATTDVEATCQALNYSVKSLKFGRVLLISNYDPNPNSRTYEHIEIEPFESVGEWGEFIVFDLYKYIDTDFIILIHADGFIVNPEKWDDDFLKYDYIGAPWPIPKDSHSFRDYYGNIIRQGNSVSLRSFKILEIPSKLKLKWEAKEGFFHEDGYLCVVKRHLLIGNGVEFAPLDIACKFSHEIPIPELKGIRPFAFHKWKGENKMYPKFGRYNIGVIDKIIQRMVGLIWKK